MKARLAGEAGTVPAFLFSEQYPMGKDSHLKFVASSSILVLKLSNSFNLLRCFLLFSEFSS
jgi:hypothetical protein